VRLSAAALWELRASAGANPGVTVRTAGGRNRPGIRIHRTPSVAPRETTIHHDIPVTAPARTLLDLAGLPASRPSSTPTTPAAPSRRASSRRRCSRSAAPTASRDRWSTRTRAGHRVVRCTDRQIAQDARTVAATLAAALGAGAVAA
jgi:hypothetical protein